MPTLDDQLHDRLHSAAPEPPEHGDDLFGRLEGRKRRRHVTRRVGSGVLAVVVLAATVGGFLALDRAFRRGTRMPVATPTTANGPLVVVQVDDPNTAKATSHLELVPLDGSATQRLTPDEPVDAFQGVSASPDGHTIAYVFGDAGEGGKPVTLTVLDLATGEQRDLARGVIDGPAWSPDGTRIAYAQYFETPGIWIVPADGSGEPGLVPGSEVVGGSPSWSPDGAAIAFEERDVKGGPAVVTIDLGSGRFRVLATTDGDTPANPVWSPDGSKITYAMSGGIWSVDAAGGDPSLQVGTTRDAWMQAGFPPSPRLQSWSPDGLSIAYVLGGIDDSNIYVDALDGSEPRLLGSGVDFAWLPATGASIAPPLIPTETASPTPQGLDVGLDFLLCDASSLGGIDLLGDGTDGTAWAGTKARPDGTCPPGGTDTPVVAYDHTGDGRADVFDPYGMAYCIGCAPFGEIILTGGGYDDLVVLSQGGTEIQYQLFHADIREGDVWFGPVFVTGAGDPRWGFVADQPFTFWAGGDEGRAEFVECTGDGGTTLVLTQRRAPIDGHTITIHETRLQMGNHGSIQVIGTSETTAQVGDTLPHENTGPTCGGLDFDPWA